MDKQRHVGCIYLFRCPRCEYNSHQGTRCEADNYPRRKWLITPADFTLGNKFGFLLTRNGEFDRYLTPGLQGRSTRYCHAAFTQGHHLTTNLRLVRFADRRRDRDRATKVAQALTNNQSIGSLQGAANRAG